MSFGCFTLRPAIADGNSEGRDRLELADSVSSRRRPKAARRGKSPGFQRLLSAVMGNRGCRPTAVVGRAVLTIIPGFLWRAQVTSALCCGVSCCDTSFAPYARSAALSELNQAKRFMRAAIAKALLMGRS